MRSVVMGRHTFDVLQLRAAITFRENPGSVACQAPTGPEAAGRRRLKEGIAGLAGQYAALGAKP